MAIDPRIALGVQPMQFQQQDPNAGMNALARMMQVSGAMDEQRLNSLKYQELQRGVDETNRLNSVWAGAVGADGSIDQNKLYGGMASGNLGSRIPAVKKQLLEADEARFKVQNEAAKGYDRFRRTVGAHAAQPVPSREAVAADVQGLVASGSMDGTIAQRLLEAMPADPQQLRLYLQGAVTSQMDPKDMLTAFAPKPTEVANGQQKFFRDMNPNSPTYGQNTGGAPVQMQMTPGEMATDRRAGAQLAEDKRHHGITESQGAQTVAQGAVEYKQDASGQWMAFPKKAAIGPVQAQTVTGPGGQPLPTKNEVSAKNALGIIDQAEQLIDGATGSYLGAGADIAMQAVGKATPGAVNTAKLKALEGALMMAQPRMEGPQSDKDVALYRQMAAQIGDPTVPGAMKKAALQTVRELHQRYAPPAAPNTGGATGDWGGGPGKVVDFGSLR